MEGKMGAIVAIEPKTGEILCMVSAPSYDPHRMEGKQRSSQMMEMQRDPMKPMLNRAISGTYPPGSTFKTSQGLTFLQEGIITSSTAYPCYRGFVTKGMRVGCHGHGSPLPLIPAIATSCNGYFCWGLYHMLSNRKQYKNIQEALTTWKDYMVSMGFGYKLGVDLPGEVRGMIPNADYYDRRLGQWNALGVISIAIGQGEVTLTPLQIANLGATIANRGYYVTPHIVKKIEGGHIADSLKVKHKTKVEKKYYDMVVEGMRKAVLGGTCRSANTSMYEELYAPLPDAEAYLERIGLSGERPAPTPEWLDRIVHAQLTHIPFDAMDCWGRGDTPSLATEDLFDKIVRIKYDVPND